VLIIRRSGVQAAWKNCDSNLTSKQIFNKDAVDITSGLTMFEKSLIEN